MLTNKELDVVMCTELAAIQELLQTDATTASIREALRLIARTVEREAYRRAAAECRVTCGKNHANAATFKSGTKAYVQGCDDCEDAIRALGEQHD